MFGLVYLYIVVIIILLLILIYSSRNLESNMLHGFWKADADFCKNAELDIFMLYLGNRTGYFSNTRYGYLLAKNDQGLILNHPIEITFSGTSVAPWVKFYRSYTVHIDWQDIEHEEDTFPSVSSAMYFPLHNKIVFYKDDTVLAILYKDASLSANIEEGLTVPEETLK